MVSAGGISMNRVGNTERCGAYDLAVKLRLSDERLLLAPTLGTGPSPTLRLDPGTAAGGDTDHVHVSSFDGHLDGGLGTVVREDPTVEEAVLLASFSEETVYRVVPAAGTFRPLEPFADVEAIVREVVGHAGHWRVRAYLPSRSALSTVVDYLRDRGIELEVEQLLDLREIEYPEVPTLTEPQRTLLTEAVERGYFETPRGVSQRELASAFDVSPSAISQRLRNATGTVVEQMLLAR